MDTWSCKYYLLRKGRVPQAFPEPKTATFTCHAASKALLESGSSRVNALPVLGPKLESRVEYLLVDEPTQNGKAG
jgi:hypothetical protein